MGISCKCITNDFNEGTELRPVPNNPELNINNTILIDEPKYQEKNKEFFKMLNDMRINPEQYIGDSKEYNLFENFMKLRPSNELTFSENNINNIKKYIIDHYPQNKKISDKEEDIKLIVNEGKIKDICLFEVTFNNFNDIKENVWHFLVENEDDFEKIFSKKYNKLIILSFLIKDNSKIFTNLIFYQD